MAAPTVGVLALQGAFAAHQSVLESLGCDTRQVRTPDDLALVDAIVLPGGESTTMAKLLETSRLRAPLGSAMKNGLAAFGTCAGMIMLATDVEDGRDDQWSYGALDISVRRNAYGRQVDSFESDLCVEGLPDRFHAIFIRAPRITRWADVDVLATHASEPVLVRKGRVWAASFHPELSGDSGIHRLFLECLRKE